MTTFGTGLACIAAATLLIGGSAAHAAVTTTGGTSQKPTVEKPATSTLPRLRTNGIDSADSCQLHRTPKRVSATGQCIGSKSCTLQERKEKSAQPWRNAVANIQEPEPTMEYRPNCV